MIRCRACRQKECRTTGRQRLSPAPSRMPNDEQGRTGGGPVAGGPDRARATRHRVADRGNHRARPVRVRSGDGHRERVRARIRSRSDQLASAADGLRRRSFVFAAIADTHDLDRNVGGGILAGAIAYRLFLFMVPFVYVLFTILGVASAVASKNPADLAKNVGISGVLAHAVVSVHKLKTSTQVLLLIGATYALLHTARSLTKALFSVHSLVWSIPPVRLKGLKPVFAFIGVVVVMGFLTPLFDRLRNAAWGLGALFAILAVTALAAVVWWWASVHLPHPDVPARALIPGALLLGVGVELLHAVTVYWIAHEVAKKSETYGTVGIALTVLFWTYFLGRIIVASVGINVTLWRTRTSGHCLAS